MDVEALKAKLRERGASLKGRKADLIERLEAYDRNQNFDAVQAEENDDPKMVLPESHAYRDINSSMKLPPITKEHITLYFLQFHKNPKDGKSLYEARFLHILRAAFIGDSCYFKGYIKASMKRIMYEANVKLSIKGEILECNCECVAGSGVCAHCKHVAVVVCGLENFINDKILLKTEAPTEKLQTFHMPKKIFTGSPLKAHKLPSKRKSIENIVFEPYKKRINILEYTQKVRNIILNCKSQKPFKQLYVPANPYAIENDHDYCGPVTNKIFEQLELNTLSLNRIQEIECETCVSEIILNGLFTESVA
ncbi:uncharacterized protein LOC121725370 [Aricia agestis]|uniref:uncharacterized protein LOC121725370 n=1 Tax=Aricia agestis TaxID=91739 RepID=UPI001C2092A7|nr:uncharacterized protein LOC121725370 [Aricia agestis]